MTFCRFCKNHLKTPYRPLDKTSVRKRIQVLSSRFGKLNQILLLVSDEINCQVLIYVLSAARTFIKPELGVKSYQQHDVQENRKDQLNSEILG